MVHEFYETKARCHKTREPLPVDINKPVEDQLELLQCEELVTMAKEIREKKLFGKLFYYLNGVEVVTIHYNYGMAPRYELIYNAGLNYPKLVKKMQDIYGKLSPIVFFKISVYNQNIVTKSKERNHGKAVPKN